VAYNVISKEELTLHSSNKSKANKEPSTKLPNNPKLTMKLLHELIRELKRDNLVLTARFDDMKRQLTEQQTMLQEAGAAAEQHVRNKPQMTAADVEIESIPDVPEFIRITRSERHFAPKRKFFGFF
jgi:predicted component of type VI protein secretion system